VTTIGEVEVTCAVCGTTSPQTVLTSTSTFGPPDLDTRPAELQRSTIWLWVQACPSCGACAPDLEKTPTAAAETLEDDAYRRQLHSADYPDLANRFLGAALIQERAGDLAEAGWSALHAAWVCDDERDERSAASARERAADLLSAARSAGQRFGPDRASEHALLADVLRRASHFDEALIESEAGVAADPDGVVRDVLELERWLIERRDAAAHTVDEAVAQS
jgi:hypothetical protein